MTQLLFCTDLHLDFVPGKAKQLGEYLARDYPEVKGMLLTGDISNGERLANDINKLAEGFNKPIYFITGNHSYYKKSFAYVDAKIKELTNPNLIYLDKGNVLLDDNTTLVGNSNWYDCRFGNVENTSVELNDFRLIDDWKRLKFRRQHIEVSQERADLKAKMLKEALGKVTTKRIIVGVHVPPFPESAWHMGNISDNEWQPWMSSIVTGQTLLDYHEANPDKEIIVCCGHSHSKGLLKIDDRLVCYTGKAEYGYPKESGLIVIGQDKIEVILK